MMLASAARAADAAVPAVSDPGAPPPAAAVTDAGAQRESFDHLMNSLLETVCPAAVPDKIRTPTADGEAPATTDIVADLDAFSACLPVPPLAETLPHGGKVLPSPTPEPGGAAASDSLDDLLAVPAPSADAILPGLILSPGPVPEPEAASAVASSLPALDSAQSKDAQALAAPLVSDAAPATATPLPSAVSSSAPVETAAHDIAVVPASPDGPARAEQALQPRADTPLPLPAEAHAAGGHRSTTQDGDTEGQARLQELLARLSASDGAAHAPGETFRNLLQGADGGAPAHAAALTYAPAASARDAAVPSLPVHTPLRHPEWGDEVSQRIRWAIGNQVQSAELKINPPQLGPVEVRVSVDADRQMTVTLASQHALVREALTDSLPRLRDLMSEHGFSAVNVDVSQQSTPDGRQGSAQMEAGPAPRADADREAETGAAPRHAVRGLVDLYA